MKTLRKKWLETYGYNPEDYEILDCYRCGTLRLTDKQENELLQYFEQNNIKQ